MAFLSRKKCFPNIIQPTRQVDIIYQNWTLVEATLLCMDELLEKDWQYVINLCAHDFPLKTNGDIVRHLKVLNGQNSIETVRFTAGKRSRVEQRVND